MDTTTPDGNYMLSVGFLRLAYDALIWAKAPAQNQRAQIVASLDNARSAVRQLEQLLAEEQDKSP